MKSSIAWAIYMGIFQKACAWELLSWQVYITHITEMGSSEVTALNDFMIQLEIMCTILLKQHLQTFLDLHQLLDSYWNCSAANAK